MDKCQAGWTRMNGIKLWKQKNRYSSNLTLQCLLSFIKTDVSNMRPVCQIQPMIGCGVGPWSHPRDGEGLAPAALVSASLTPSSTMTRPHPPRPPEGKQTPDAACDRIEFDTPALKHSFSWWGENQWMCWRDRIARVIPLWFILKNGEIMLRHCRDLPSANRGQIPGTRRQAQLSVPDYAMCTIFMGHFKKMSSGSRTPQ